MPEARDHKLTIRLSERELDLLKAVAAAEDLTVSEWIRIAARLAFDKIKPHTKPKSAAKHVPVAVHKAKGKAKAKKRK